MFLRTMALGALVLAGLASISVAAQRSAADRPWTAPDLAAYPVLPSDPNDRTARKICEKLDDDDHHDHDGDDDDDD